MGQTISAVLRYLQVSTSEVAELWGISRQAASFKLKGRQPIRLEEAEALARFLSVSVELFFLNYREAVVWVVKHADELPEHLTRMKYSAQEVVGDEGNFWWAGDRPVPVGKMLSIKEP